MKSLTDPMECNFYYTLSWESNYCEVLENDQIYVGGINILVWLRPLGCSELCEIDN